MKTTTTLITAGVIALGGCSSMTKVSTGLEPGEQTPAALAEVSYDGEAQGNSELTLDVDHLPPPSELGDEFSTFVVWMTPKGSDEPRNVGQLDYDPNDREGTLDFITPYNEFTLAVTAESAPNPLQKSEVVIVSGNVDVRKR